jgi:hypothetical protein
MAGATHNDRLLRAVFSKGLKRRHPMRTGQLDGKERLVALLENKNAAIGTGGPVCLPGLRLAFKQLSQKSESISLRQNSLYAVHSGGYLGSRTSATTRGAK